MTQGSVGQAGRRDGRQTSPWAILSMLAATFFLCPLSTAAAPLLGLKAISEMRVNPAVKGRRLAYAGITIGLVLTGLWIIVAVWWNANARKPMMNGPIVALQAGFNGDVRGFMDGFCCEASVASEQDAAAFLSALSRRYGRLRGIRQSTDVPPPEQPTGPGLRKRIPYLLEFERKTVPAVAEFVVFTSHIFEPELKFSSIEVFDDEQGALMYPPSLQSPDAGGPSTQQPDAKEPSSSGP